MTDEIITLRSYESMLEEEKKRRAESNQTIEAALRPLYSAWSAIIQQKEKSQTVVYDEDNQFQLLEDVFLKLPPKVNKKADNQLIGNRQTNSYSFTEWRKFYFPLSSVGLPSPANGGRMLLERQEELFKAAEESWVKRLEAISFSELESISKRLGFNSTENYVRFALSEIEKARVYAQTLEDR